MRYEGTRLQLTLVFPSQVVISNEMYLKKKSQKQSDQRNGVGTI